MTSSLHQQTGAARAALLELHRVLLDAVRLEHERLHGRVGSGEMLQLVAYDPGFAWLRPVSELIVALDELEAMPEVSERDAAAVRVEIEELLSGRGGGFPERYLAALQTSPALVLAHSGAQRAIAALPASRPEEVQDLLTARRGWKAPRRGPAGGR
ncbi:MAG: hypothetical protein M3542_02600 [Acidobacteriota bacterium]|nr:hypothetical protein [Acidobacteriota bacterium]MDQ5871006.1 hypothetical protein [Acidobacteriota bacterium]